VFPAWSNTSCRFFALMCAARSRLDVLGDSVGLKLRMPYGG
jgi:hypothetical protein